MVQGPSSKFEIFVLPKHGLKKEKENRKSHLSQSGSRSHKRLEGRGIETRERTS